MSYFKRSDESLARPPWIYFIQCGKFVKIGTTFGDPRLRVQMVRTHCPLPANLLAVIEGGRSEERRWHLRFEDELERGEWFHLSGRLMTAIQELRPRTINFPDRIRPMLSKAKQRARRRAIVGAEGQETTAIHTGVHTSGSEDLKKTIWVK